MAGIHVNHGLGDPAPAFALPDPAGRIHSLGDFSADRGLLLAFICNHCPYVIHVLDGLVKFAAEYRTRGLATVAISANDVAAYPEDGPVKMAALAKARNFSFPYLYDETQQTAKAYGAPCTPDFLAYHSGRRLPYHTPSGPARPDPQPGLQPEMEARERAWPGLKSRRGPPGRGRLLADGQSVQVEVAIPVLLALGPADHVDAHHIGRSTTLQCRPLR